MKKWQTLVYFSFLQQSFLAGNKDQIQCVIEANIIHPLIQMLTMAEFDVKKEAAWAISNATSGGTPAQIK